MQLSDNEWKKRLTPEQYQVLREKSTEAPFSGNLLYNEEVGTYVCAACGEQLFSSDTKFDANCGWPSFYDVKSTKAVRLQADHGHGMHRIEVLCTSCGGHLGHVFNDAPDQPTGMHFCINSVSLDFKPANKAKNKEKA